MASLKRFWSDETGTAEATSTVIMIAAVGVLLSAGLIAWYGNINSFFTSAGGAVAGEAGKMTLP